MSGTEDCLGVVGRHGGAEEDEKDGHDGGSEEGGERKTEEAGLFHSIVSEHVSWCFWSPLCMRNIMHPCWENETGAKSKLQEEVRTKDAGREEEGDAR